MSWSPLGVSQATAERDAVQDMAKPPASRGLVEGLR